MQSAFPRSDANLFDWVGTIEGAAGTVWSLPTPVLAILNGRAIQVYAGLRFKIAIHFPSNYPMAPPTIKFESPCFHPNVDINGGGICLDILQVRSPLALGICG